MTANLLATLTGTTCGAACWYANEEACHCSCGGRNHGVMKTDDGKRPERTCKMQGAFYRLQCVGDFHEVSHELRKIHDYLMKNQDAAPVRWYSATERKSASKAQQKWPEVAGWVEQHPNDYCYLGWVRTAVPTDLPIE